MSEKKEFKAESRRLLDLMINSIYTHKEIFLRELISNASDALDKYYYQALEQHEDPGTLSIRVELDEESRTLTITDNGIGMSEEELEENLGTIAKSGSLAFKEEMAKKEQGTSDVDIIGQFGVGFYAAFMVADSVTVMSKAAGSDQAYEWKSNGANGYVIEPCTKEERGTTIILHLKKDDDEEAYSEYLTSWKVRELVKKYSDYIRYPIQLTVETTEETLNSMTPLWKRNKSEVTEEEFAQFYKDHFYDYADPLKTIFFKLEGSVEFTALLYIPSHVPSGFYTKEYKPGLQLYSRGVFIMDHCEELLPPCLRFVSGLVDSQDLSLNISREMLQHDRQLAVIRGRIEKKVLNELGSMLAKDRETYEKFFTNFGLDLKFGIYSSFGADRDKLENLILFDSAREKKLVTLQEYVSAMAEGQKDIYYAVGSSKQTLEKQPIVTSLLAKGYDVLLCNAEVDEFVITTLNEYQEHPFKNVAASDLDLGTEEEKQALEKSTEENKGLLDFVKETLGEEVKEVRLSARLGDDPVTLVSGDGISFEMERVYQAMAASEGEQMPPLKAERILELNPEASIFKTLQAAYASDKDKAAKIAEVLYDQALLIEGFKVKDPIAYARLVAELIQ